MPCSSRSINLRPCGRIYQESGDRAILLRALTLRPAFTYVKKRRIYSQQTFPSCNHPFPLCEILARSPCIYSSRPPTQFSSPQHQAGATSCFYRRLSERRFPPLPSILGTFIKSSDRLQNCSHSQHASVGKQANFYLNWQISRCTGHLQLNLGGTKALSKSICYLLFFCLFLAISLLQITKVSGAAASYTSLQSWLISIESGFSAKPTSRQERRLILGGCDILYVLLFGLLEVTEVSGATASYSTLERRWLSAKKSNISSISITCILELIHLPGRNRRCNNS